MWLLLGPAMRFWLVPWCLRIAYGLIAFNSGFYSVTVLVHFAERNAAEDFDTCCWLGWGTSAVWCGVRDSRLCNLGVHQDVESWGVCAGSSSHNWPVLWWCEQWAGNSGQDHERSGQRGITCFSCWRLPHISWVLQGVPWQWLHEDPCRLPGFRCKIVEAMPAKNCISSVWDIGPLFNDRVHCCEIEGGGASRLDAVKAVST